MSQDFAFRRQQMVQEQIVKRGIYDVNVLEAMRSVPRHEFVPQALKEHAYDDGPLSIGEGQTISQPYIVALMTQAAKLNSHSKVLEIGTGSGYAAAILGSIAKEVHTIERIPLLAQKAQILLKQLGYENIQIHEGDGTLGLPEIRDFDAIIVTAGAPVMPQALKSQVKEQGKIIIPVGSDPALQQLLCLTKMTQDQFSQELLEFVRFVPLIGEQGWKDKAKG